ncbi:MAG TPA: glycosyltransferase 87 family protein [Propionicimonas sp.]
MGEPRWGPVRIGFSLLAIVLGLMLVTYLVGGLDQQLAGSDFGVYRGAIQLVWSGGSLYDFTLSIPGAGPMPFTYPPFAALFLAPVAALPGDSARWTWTVIQLALCPVLAWITIRATPARRHGRSLEGWLVLGLSTVALVLTEPFVHGIALGQVSLALAALVIVDISLVPPRWRGVLTGIAGAVKLLPMVFLPYYLITRQWRPARNCVAGFVGSTVLALVVLPADSMRYWTTMILATDRVGLPGESRNTSLLGLLTHGGIGVSWLWVALALVLGGASLLRARALFVRGQEFSAMLTVGVLSTVLSPISWPHHLVWISVGGLYLVLTGRRWPRLIGIGVLALFVMNTPFIGFEATTEVWVNLARTLPSLVLIGFAVLGFPEGRTAGAVEARSAVPEPTAP